MTSQYRKLNSARFTSIVSLVPVEIFVTFQLADNPEFYSYLGLSLVVPLLIEVLLQAKFSSLLDSRSRKSLLILNEATNSAVLVSVFSGSFFLGEYNVFLDFTTLISIEIFLFITYQTYMALAKEIVADNAMGNYNGLSEIISQFPVLIGTFVSSLIFLEIGLRGLLILALALHMFAVLQLRGVEEAFGKSCRPAGQGSLIGSIPYLKSNFRNVFFIFLLNFPFIAIIAGNFLNPIFIASNLNGNASSLAYSDSVYALLAMLTGLLAPRLMSRLGEMKSIYLFAAIFLAGSILTPEVSIFSFFLLFHALHGLGNPGVRIARNSMAMRSTPVEEIGRFNGSVSLLTIMGRLLMIGFCILTLDFIGVRGLILLMGITVFCAVVLAGILWRSDPWLKSRFGERQENTGPTYL